MIKQQKPPRPKKCKAHSCGLKFQPERQMQETCCIKCAIELTNLKRAKKAAKDAAEIFPLTLQPLLDKKIVEASKQELLAKREASKKKAEFYAKDRSHQLKLTQPVFNAWIRFRDSGKPCVSCDKPDSGTHQRHASHFRSVGACAELRFNSLNVHTSCSVCNNHLSGNIAGYRPRLIDKIGIELVEWLEGPHEPNKYTCDQLREIRAYYAKLTRHGIKSDEDRPNK